MSINAYENVHIDDIVRSGKMIACLTSIRNARDLFERECMLASCGGLFSSSGKFNRGQWLFNLEPVLELANLVRGC